MIGLGDAGDAEAKSVIVGTHRVCAPEVTLARARSAMVAAGVTRVADLTGLDEIGIPVWQAVRPNAKTLSVSQGKGMTPLLAQVSAVMEAIEVWHAEQPRGADVSCSVYEMAPLLPYTVASLPQVHGSVLSEATRLEWVAAYAYGDCGQGQVWVPKACVMLDLTDLGAVLPPVFLSSSNGLASGNTVAEAVSHGLCELLERDALACAGTSWDGRRLDLSGVTGSCVPLLEAFAGAGVSVAVRDLTDLAGPACFEAVIWSPTLAFGFTGSGCHLDPEVALSRALTEAAQSRLTLIAGARDDITSQIHQKIAARRDISDPLDRLPPPARSWAQSEGEAAVSHDQDNDLLADIVVRRTGCVPLVVNLTRPELGIPVVRVVAPGLQLSRSH